MKNSNHSIKNDNISNISIKNSKNTDLNKKKIDKKIKYKDFFNLIFGGVLLISGTCIGAGMVGLPVKTAALGFYPTVMLFIFIWAIMSFSALCMLEASLYVKGETNLIGMAHKTLGKWGGHLAWLFYIIFLYSLMAAYTSGGSTIIADIINFKINNSLDLIKIASFFVCSLGIFVYFGAKYVDYLNRLLMIGLIISYFGLLFFVDSDKNIIQQNAFGNSKFLFFTLPILITAFGYHLLIPTLKYYLKENIFALRIAIILGGFIPLLVYIFWEYEIFSLIPIWGENGLVNMLNSPENPGELLSRAVSGNSPITYRLITSFSFFALISSFVGVSLGIFDFFADGLKIKKTLKGRFILALLTFLPPAIYTILVPGGFMLALGYAGVFAAILLIIYPSAMTWSGRYIKKINSEYNVAGGKPALIFAFLFGILVIAVEILEQLHLLPLPHQI